MDTQTTGFPYEKHTLPKPKSISELEEELKNKKQEIKDVLKRVYSHDADPFSYWFAEEIIKMFMMKDLKNLETKIMNLKIINNKFENKQMNNGIKHITKEEIEIAKRYPIEELARSRLELRPSGKNFIALCPFHQEKHGSFYLYTETNSFYCYGCNKGGDNITLAIALYGVNFKDAVTMLQN